MNLPTVISEMIRAHLAGLRVGLPGRVVAYDPIKQRADVQPLVMDILNDEQGRDAVAPPIICDVPVCFPGAGQGANAWRITFPIKVGDTVEIRFMSSSIARWKLTGDGPVDPADARHHCLTDAIAVPALHDYAHVPTEAPTDAMVLHGASVKLGGPDASDPVVRRSDLDAVVADLKAHTHVVNTEGTAVAQAGTAFASPEDFSTPACSPVVKSK